MSATKEGLILLANQGFILRGTNELSLDTLPFHLSKIPFRIRKAEFSDVKSLLQVEEECWKSLKSSEDEIIRRLSNSTDQWVAVVNEAVVGVIYTQIIKSIESLKDASFKLQTTLHDETGSTLQLLGVAVLPVHAALNISLVLRDFALLVAKASNEISSVIAMTRCSSNFHTEEEYFANFRNDPTVLFHVNAGAEILEIVKNYRPQDKSNFGHSILIKYQIRESLRDERLLSRESFAPLLTKEGLCEVINGIMNSIFKADSHFLNTPFMNLGLDSLNMIELRNQLLKSLSLNENTFAPTIMFDYPTPLQLLDFINGVSSVNENFSTKFDLPSREFLVCGLSCRLPNGANDPELFYEMLINGKKTFSEIPKEWQDQCGAKFASFLDSNVASTFDPNFFGISVNEANLMDPHQRLLLELVHEALADACLLPLPTSRIGVFIGACNNEWMAHAAQSAEVSPFLGCCVAQSSMANRVSFYLGLHGPSLVIDTACSSSLSALHVALNSLENGDCDYAVVASADLLISSLSLQVKRLLVFSFCY
jgi:hypothetical protein